MTVKFVHSEWRLVFSLLHQILSSFGAFHVRVLSAMRNLYGAVRLLVSHQYAPVDRKSLHWKQMPESDASFYPRFHISVYFIGFIAYALYPVR